MNTLAGIFFLIIHDLKFKKKKKVKMTFLSKVCYNGFERLSDYLIHQKIKIKNEACKAPPHLEYVKNGKK